MTDIFFLTGIFVIAILYSSVGHGGASGYLAFMALLSINPIIMRPAALILNIAVSGIALISFARNKHFKFNLFWPFVVTSLPMAFIGGLFTIETKVYKIILGVFLLIAIARMLLQLKIRDDSKERVNIPAALFIGAVLGFFSGLIGIGGGIILSPVILLLGWANVKETAAVSAAFILINSLAGITGFVIKNPLPEMEITFMVFAGVVGGIIGSHQGSFRLNAVRLRKVLAAVLLFASIKLFIL